MNGIHVSPRVSTNCAKQLPRLCEGLADGMYERLNGPSAAHKEPDHGILSRILHRTCPALPYILWLDRYIVLSLVPEEVKSADANRDREPGYADRAFTAIPNTMKRHYHSQNVMDRYRNTCDYALIQEKSIPEFWLGGCMCGDAGSRNRQLQRTQFMRNARDLDAPSVPFLACL